MKPVSTPLLVACGLILALAGASGCSTYINVPALPGDVAVNDPNDKTVIQVITTAIPFAVKDQAYEGQYQVQFPVGTKGIVAYDALAPLDENAIWRNPPLPDMPVYHAAQVRVRSWVAEVDVIRPVNPKQLNLGNQLVTVTLKWEAASGWIPRKLRVWSISVEDAMRRAPYADPSSPMDPSVGRDPTDPTLPASRDVPSRYN
jgi:hypothetical protein